MSFYSLRKGVGLSISAGARVCVRACACVRACVRACVCVCARARARAFDCYCIPGKPVAFNKRCLGYRLNFRNGCLGIISDNGMYRLLSFCSERNHISDGRASVLYDREDKCTVVYGMIEKTGVLLCIV